MGPPDDPFHRLPCEKRQVPLLEVWAAFEQIQPFLVWTAVTLLTQEGSPLAGSECSLSLAAEHPRLCDICSACRGAYAEDATVKTDESLFLE